MLISHSWQDEILHAIMECDSTALAAALDRHGAIALNAVLHRREIGGEGLFLLGEQVYPREGALREALGSNLSLPGPHNA